MGNLNIPSVQNPSDFTDLGNTNQALLQKVPAIYSNSNNGFGIFANFIPAVRKYGHKKLFLSVFNSKEKHPSASLYCDSKGNNLWYYHDKEGIHLNAIEFIRKSKKLSFAHTIEFLYDEFVIKRGLVISNASIGKIEDVKTNKEVVSEIKSGIEVSVFYKPITNKSNHKDLDLVKVGELVKTKFKEETRQLRLIDNPADKKSFKNAQFAYAAFSGTFSYCSDKHLIKHSGLICIDIDGLKDNLKHVKEIVNSDKDYTVMSFVSPGGDGLKVIYRVDVDKHPQKVWYEHYSKRLSQLCNLPASFIDKQCYNVSRACFLPHDPEIFINPLLISK